MSKKLQEQTRLKSMKAVIRRGSLVFYGLLMSGVSSLSLAQPLFLDDTEALGGPFHIGETWGASWGDFNGDLYPDLFTSNHGALNSLLRNNGDGTFAEVVKQVDSDGVWTGSPEADIHGASWADFDNDGDQDLFVTRSSVGARFQVMENSGLNGFTEEGRQYGVGPNGSGRLPVLFDYDNDGNLDVALVTNLLNGVILFKWDPASGKYVNQSSETAIQGKCLANSSGIASDLFNTGKLNYICIKESQVPDRVFDTSTLPFKDISDRIDSVGSNTDAVFADFNNDSLMDMVVNRGRIRPAGARSISSDRIEAWFTVAGSKNFEDSMTFSADGPISVNVYARHVGNRDDLRIGSGGNTAPNLPVVLDPEDQSNHGLVNPRDDQAIYVGYDDASKEWTVMLSSGSTGAAEGAYIVVEGSNLSEPTTSGITGVDSPRPPQFLINNGNRLVNRGARGIGAIQCGGIAAADFDNDMDVDLYMACRDSISNFANRLYLNDGSGQFSLADSHGAEGIVGSGIESRTGTSGMAVTADYNVDGFMDIFVTNGNRLFPLLSKDGFTGGGPGQFFRNLANNGNHWLEIDLQGVASNRDGQGAKVFVTAGGVTQYREQNGQYHRWSQDSRRIHFGLGANTSANVTIEWPDGTTDNFTKVGSDQLYLAVQGAGLSATNPELNAPSIAISGDTVSEGETASITVSIFPPSANTIEVDYATRSGSATSSDFTPASGTLTFAPFETEQVVNIEVRPDVKDEDDELFTVILSNPVNALLSQPQGIVLIEDNDAAEIDSPKLSITDSVALEGNAMDFTISISKRPMETVIVGFETFEGSAIEGQDYQRRTGQVRFSPDGPLSALRRVMTLEDTVLESTEGFELRLLDPQNANIVSSVAKATIFDIDSVILDISINNVSVLEGLDAILTVTLSEASTVPVTVDFDTSDVTAKAGSDYTAISGSLEFAPGERSKNIILSTLQNFDVDGNKKRLNVILSNASNGVLANDVALVTITDRILGLFPALYQLLDEEEEPDN